MYKHCLKWLRRLTPALVALSCSGCELLIAPLLLLPGDKSELSAYLHPVGTFPENEVDELLGKALGMGRLRFPYDDDGQPLQPVLSISGLKANARYCVTVAENASCRATQFRTQFRGTGARYWSQYFSTDGNGNFNQEFDVEHPTPSVIHVMVTVQKNACSPSEENLVACGHATVKGVQRGIRPHFKT